jgi:hypothetical protein
MRLDMSLWPDFRYPKGELTKRTKTAINTTKAVAITAEAATEAAKQKDDKDNKEEYSERHDEFSLQRI